MHSAWFVCISFSLAAISAVSILVFLEIESVNDLTHTFGVVHAKIGQQIALTKNSSSYASLLAIISPAQNTTTDVSPDSSSKRLADDEQLPMLRSVFDPDRKIKIYRDAEIGTLAYLFFHARICESLMMPNSTLEEHAKHLTMVDISFNCRYTFEKLPFGTGNLIMIFYTLRAAAHVMGKTDVIMQCNDAESSKDSLILPWLMGIFPISPHDSSKAIKHPTVEDVCNYKLPGPMRSAVVLGWIFNEMQFELRRMAIAMVGIPSPDHPSAAWAEENLWSNSAGTNRHGRNYMQLPHPKKGEVPLYPGTQIDDAILHFRCGDLANSNVYEMMGFMSFKSFAQHISPEARSIGIVTQPFDEDAAQVRQRESNGVVKDRCRVLVGAFVDYLKEHFPKARVSVHNNHNETIVVTFARMVMAKQTVVGISTFGEFAALATFGTGYIRHVTGDLHDWMVTPPMLERLEHVVLIPEPMLIPADFKKQWEDNFTSVLEWFKK